MGVSADGTIWIGSTRIAAFFLVFDFFCGGDGVLEEEEVVGFGDGGASVVMGIEPTKNVVCGDFGEDDGDDC
jgi:hypothetical protein